MSRFSNKVAVITGATLAEPGGPNIGGAAAFEIAGQGGRVVLAGRDADGTQHLENHLNERFGPGTASAFTLDLSSEEQVARLVAQAVDTATQYGPAGVRCNAVVPGVTTSPKVQQVPGAVTDIYARHILRDGHTSPTEAAKVYAFLASDDSAGLNGISVRADSGLFATSPSPRT